MNTTTQTPKATRPWYGTALAVLLVFGVLLYFMRFASGMIWVGVILGEYFRGIDGSIIGILGVSTMLVGFPLFMGGIHLWAIYGAWKGKKPGIIMALTIATLSIPQAIKIIQTIIKEGSTLTGINYVVSTVLIFSGAIACLKHPFYNKKQETPPNDKDLGTTG